MSGINNISGSPTTPIQHSPSQASGPARLVINNPNQARDHWRAIGLTSTSQASDAMEVLDTRAEKGHTEEGHIDEGTYLHLANALRDVHSILQREETTQAAVAHLPVRPPAPLWQPPTRAVQGFVVEHGAALQAMGYSAGDMRHLATRPAADVHQQPASDAQIRAQLMNPDGTQRTRQEVIDALRAIGLGAGRARSD
jgi:hypothetical protein